jgi:hypothetical protein
VRPEHGTAPYDEGADAETKLNQVARILEEVPQPRQGREATHRTQWVHEVRKDSGLSRTTKLVALTLAAHMDTSGLCWPSITTIAQGAGLKRRATILHLSKLEAAGYIRRRKGVGRGNTTRYEACKKVHEDSLKGARGRPEKVHPHAPEVSTKYLKASPMQKGARNNTWEPPNPRPALTAERLSEGRCSDCGGWSEHREWCSA